MIPRAATRGLFALLEAGLDILIRDYGAGDSAAVIDLIRELQTHELALYDRMKPPSEIGPWYIEKLLEACADHRGRLLVAEEDGRILGYACVLTAVSSETELDEVAYRYASIEDLVVTCDHRRRGLGSRLLKARAQQNPIGRPPQAPPKATSAMTITSNGILNHYNFMCSLDI